jgi:hypothetical protein
MSIKWHRREVKMADLEKIKKIINDPGTFKIVGTVGVDGVPHTALKQTLHINEDGNIEFVELLESSVSFKNITGVSGLTKKFPYWCLGQTEKAMRLQAKLIVS